MTKSKIKVLLINPPFLSKFSRSQRSPAVTKGGTLYYPYWLAFTSLWIGVQAQYYFGYPLGLLSGAGDERYYLQVCAQKKLL